MGVKREKPIAKTAGPGEYDVDKAQDTIRAKSPNIRINKQGRPDNFTRPQADKDLGPGAYRTQRNFGEDLKPVTMGAKREKPI